MAVNWRLLGNSVAVSGAATFMACVFGLCAALWLAGLGGRARKPGLIASIVALVLPPFLATNCWIHFLGATGVWREWLPASIYSMGGVIWIMALMYWPITLLLVLGAWERLEPAYFEVDPALRASSLVRWLLFPAGRPALGQAALITFVLALNHFAVPTILQVKVFPAEVWLKLSTELDYAGAWLMSAPLIGVSVIALLLLRGKGTAWPRYQETAPSQVLRQQLGPALYGSCVGVSALVVFCSVVLPLGQILIDAKTWSELPKLFGAATTLASNSFLFAAGAATICVLLAIWTWRWRIGWLGWIFFLAPGVLIGTAMIFLFNRPMLDAVYHSMAVVLIAFVCRFAALNWQGARQSMQRVDPNLVDAVRLETGSRWQLFRRGYWPQTAGTFAALWYVTYLLCLWEVESLIMIYPPGGETLALRVFNLLHYGHIAQVNALCLLLLGLALAPLVVWGAVRRSAVLLAVLLLVGCREEEAFQSEFFSGVQVIGHRGVGVGELNKPRSVAVDRNDNLYVVDLTGRVQKFSPRGEFLLSWQMPQTDKGKPKGMCRDSQGNIVVLEPHYSRVNHFTSHGKLAGQWGAHGTNIAELAFPRSVAVNSKGDILVSEYGLTERVQCFSGDGKTFARHFGKAGDGPGEFNRPEGLGIDAQDRVYVADSCNHRVQIFSPEGQWLATYGGPGTGPGRMNYPYDVRVDAQGFQYVCEFGNSRVQIFDAHNRLVEVLGGAGAAPGKMNNPWAIALDSQGNLYVADAGNHRVLKFVRRIRAASLSPLVIVILLLILIDSKTTRLGLRLRVGLRSDK